MGKNRGKIEVERNWSDIIIIDILQMHVREMI